MKILDLIPLEKHTELNIRKGTNWQGEEYSHCYNTATSQKMFLDRGYFYDVDILSSDALWLEKNIEKDNVVAYFHETFTTLILIYSRSKYYGLRYVNTTNLGMVSFNVFSFGKMNTNTILRIFEKHSDKIKVVDKELYEMAKRQRTLKAIEEEYG